LITCSDLYPTIKVTGAANLKQFSSPSLFNISNAFSSQKVLVSNNLHFCLNSCIMRSKILLKRYVNYVGKGTKLCGYWPRRSHCRGRSRSCKWPGSLHDCWTSRCRRKRGQRPCAGGD